MTSHPKTRVARMAQTTQNPPGPFITRASVPKNRPHVRRHGVAAKTHIARQPGIGQGHNCGQGNQLFVANQPMPLAQKTLAPGSGHIACWWVKP